MANERKPAHNPRPNPRAVPARVQGKGKGTYTENQKIAALTAAHTASPKHPMGDVALQAARDVLGHNINVSTLFHWNTEYGSRITSAIAAIEHSDIEATGIIATTRTSVLQRFTTILDRLLSNVEMRSFENDTLRDITILMGTIYDKIDSAVGVSPSTRIKLHTIELLCTQIGYVMDDTLDDLIVSLQAIARARTSTSAAPDDPD
jgi:hypothetical protein